jgi:hypothetical protein
LFTSADLPPAVFSILPKPDILAFLHALIERALASPGVEAGGRARTSIAAAALIPVLNASEAASDGFAAACLLPKIRARLRSAMRALLPLCFFAVVVIVGIIIFGSIRIVIIIFRIIVAFVFFRVVVAHRLPSSSRSSSSSARRAFAFWLFSSSLRKPTRHVQ